MAITRTNLMPNPSFEVSIADWGPASGSTTTQLARSTAESWSGSASLKAWKSTSSPSVSMGNETPKFQGITGGVTYTMSFYTKTDYTTAATDVFVQILWYNASNGYVGVSQAYATTGTAWSRVTITATAPSSATQCEISLSADGPTGLAHYYDAFLFEEASTALPYFDGSFATTGSAIYGWTGTLHDSASIEVSSDAASSIERLSPDSIVGITGGSGSVTDLQDDPDLPDANWINLTGSFTSVIVSFPTPSQPLTASTQTFRVLMNNAAGADLFCDLYDNGTWVDWTTDEYTGDGTQRVVSFTFPTASVSATGCEIEVYGPNIKIGAIEWLAEVQTGAAGPGEGSGSGSFSWTGSGAGVAPAPANPEGAASGGWEFTGSGIGQSPGVGEHAGTASGTWLVSGSAQGEAPGDGAASGSWAWAGSATGKRNRFGWGSGTYEFYLVEASGSSPAGAGEDQDVLIDFSTYAEGALPAGEFTTGGGIWDIVTGMLHQFQSGGYFYGPYSIRHANQPSNNKVFDVRLLVSSSSAGKAGIEAFKTGGSTSITGYWFRKSGTSAQLWKWTGSNSDSGVALATVSGLSGDVWLRYRYEGDGVHQIKAWNAASTEPSSFTLVTDTTYTGKVPTPSITTNGRSTHQYLKKYGYLIPWVPEGAVSGAWSFGGTAGGTAPAYNWAEGLWEYAGSAVGETPPDAPGEGTADGAWDFAGDATGEAPVLPIPEGDAAGSWNVVASTATGARASAGVAAGAWAVAGSSTGQSSLAGSGAGSWAVAGSAAGSATAKGLASGAWTMAGAAEGSSPVTGLAAGSWAFVGTAEGTSIGGGLSTGAWAFAGTAAGETETRGAAAGAWATAGSATGDAEHRGTAVPGAWGYTGDAAGEHTADGDAAGTWQVTGSSTGSKPSRGAASGSWTEAGTGATGRRASRGATVVSYSYAATASGSTEKRGATAGTHRWVGVSLGELAARGAAEAGAWEFTGAAEGIALVRDVTVTTTLLPDRLTTTALGDRIKTRVVMQDRLRVTLEKE